MLYIRASVSGMLGAIRASVVELSLSTIVGDMGGVGGAGGMGGLFWYRD